MSNYPTNWASNAIQTVPSLSDLKSSGYPTNGDPAKGIPPTLPGAAWFHWVTQTLASAIVGNGLTIDQTDTDQLLRSMKALGKAVVPIGSVIFYLGTTIPTGYLLCNGASLSRTEYPELFSVIGTKVGAADSAHFSIPNAHHRFLEGTTVLSEVGKYIEEGLPNIIATLGVRPYVDWAGCTEGFSDWRDGRSEEEGVELAHGDVKPNRIADFSASNSNATYGAANTVQPNSLRALVLVRAY